MKVYVEEVRPRHKNVILEPIDQPVSEVIIAPDVAQKRATMGKVLSIGPEVEAVEVGEIVYYGAYAGSEWDFEGRKCVMVKEDDIEGVVEGEIKTMTRANPAETGLVEAGLL